MKIKICTINHNEREERVTISYDTDGRKLYADNEIIDTPELDTIEAAEDFCAAAWGVDPVGVWNLEWIERDEPQTVTRYEIKTDSFEFRMGSRRSAIPSMSAAEIMDTYLSCDTRITSNGLDPDLRASFDSVAEAVKFFRVNYANYGSTRLERGSIGYLLRGEIAWIEQNDYDANGEFDQGGDVVEFAAEPYTAEESDE